MKGVVFNLLEEIVTAQYGLSAWDELLEKTQLDGAYTSLGSYPDADFLKLVATAGATFGKSNDEIVRWFGRGALSLLAERYPHFLMPHTQTRAFLLTLNDIIHPEVRKIYPGADVPVFDFDTSKKSSLAIGYNSARKLCAFAEGMIEGAAAHYGEQVEIAQPQCMKRGDERCLLVCSFKPATRE
ncbi:heme NO-binding domain-containing protein [Nitrococcus mobilis]|uniref:4-vinyl reductase 4VR domain-containing protein n=1 Tax=Nitrococcus mobilis Nb-231 TaxID=314278 RepID=A4BV90_9GAMM|nr:heme NO-binding domain-containing protein [Nitrococcus mobilis]EAR20357.1 hypothetical protein NB231_06780 [Nitrococcus mobilis Nb-231]